MRWQGSGRRFIRSGLMRMTRKILFTDLDGTLLDDKKEISRVTYETLAAFLGDGNLLVLSSGRDINSINEIKERLGLSFPGIYLTGYNGSQIYDCDNKKTIYRNGLKTEQAVFIVETALKMGIHCHTYNETHIICHTDVLESGLNIFNKEFTFYKKDVHTPVIFSSDLRTDVITEPGKCIAINLDDKTRLESLRDKILSVYDDITCLFSCPIFLEIFPASSGKGAALTKLCEILDIPIKNSIASGDQENDLTMLGAAGFSIAMANAVPTLKNIADVVTEFDNNHDGLAVALRSIK